LIYYIILASVLL